MDERIEIRPERYVNILSSRNPETDITVFLLHGLGGRADQWRGQYDVLKNHYSVIVPDLLGHGRSDKPQSNQTNIYSFQEMNQDVEAIFQHYASAKNIIVGHSYGGALAASLALAHQDKIDKLILISPTPLAPDTHIPFLFTLPAPVMEFIRPILERNMAGLIFDPTADTDLIQNEIRISRQNPMHVIKSLVNGIRLVPITDVSNLDVPTLIILGEHDKLIAAAVSQDFYQALPNHKVIILEKVGHMANMEKPMLVNELFIEWIRQQTHQTT